MLQVALPNCILLVFTAHVYVARTMLWQDVCPSVSPSVCHTPILSLNGCTCHQSFFTIE